MTPSTECPYCHKDFVPKESAMRDEALVFCSKRCKNYYRAEAREEERIRDAEHDGAFTEIQGGFMKIDLDLAENPAEET